MNDQNKSTEDVPAKKWIHATDEQNEAAQKECLAVAIETLQEAFGGRGFADGNAISSDRFVKAMDAAHDMISFTARSFETREKLDFVSVERDHILASAFFAAWMEFDAVNPYSAGGMALLAFSRWENLNDARGLLDVAEDGLREILGNGDPEETLTALDKTP